MFELDSRLSGDCIRVGDLPLCSVLLMNDSRYPWLILVPRRQDVTELFHLEAEDQAQLWGEVTEVSQGLRDALGAKKMNVATLGNVVAQLHIHVIARFDDDTAWPGPVWGRHPAIPYEQVEILTLLERIRPIFGDQFVLSEAWV